jgi:hypothetical protein
MHNYFITVFITTVSLCNLHSFMFRHFRFIVREFTTNAWISDTRSSNCICSHKHVLIARDCNIEKVLFYCSVKKKIF